MEKKRVAIIGVTGAVGQEFVQSLENHPWFEVTQIAASERSAGKNYLDAIKDASGIVAWDVGGEIPEYIKSMTVKRIDELDVSQLDLVFSAVESVAARDIETAMAANLFQSSFQELMMSNLNYLKLKRKTVTVKVG